MAYGKEFEKKFIVEYSANNKNLDKTAEILNLDTKSAKYLEKKLCSTPVKATKKVEPIKQEVKTKPVKTNLYHDFTKQEIAEVKLMKGYGMSYGEIAAKIGVDKERVYNLVYRLNRGMNKSKISTAIKSQVQSKKELPQIRVESKPNIQVSTEIVGEKEVRITIKY